MISAKDVMNYIKGFSVMPTYTVGKLDATKTETLCVYNAGSIPYRGTVGGGAKTFDEGRYKILVRYGTNYPAAEVKAQNIYGLLDGTKTVVNNRTVWFYPLYNEPILLGTDDKGIFEFSIEVKTISER